MVDCLNFSPLFGSNRCPNAAEEQSIRSALENARIVRDQYRDDAARLRARLAEAEANIAQIESYISSHQRALSAFRRLPIEILITIFKLTLDVKVSPSAPLGYCVTSFREGPWNLSFVCHHWREIVVNCPALWSSFTISTSRSSYKLEKAFQSVMAALGRTGQHLLVFRVDIWSESPALRSVVQWLLKESHRWENVEIVVGCFVRGGLLDGNRKFGALQRLYLRSRNDEDLRSCQNVFAIAPQLKEVTLIHDGTLEAFNLPWSQISNVTVRAVTISYLFLEALYKSANCLEQLDLSCRIFTLPENGRIHPWTFPVLRSLNIDRATILSFLHIPAVEMLYCLEPIWTLSFAGDLMSSALMKNHLSCAFLRKLYMFDRTSTADDMLLILRAAPQLQDLAIRVQGPACGRYFSQLLLPLTVKPLLVPHLRDFFFEEQYEGDDLRQYWSVQKLIDMVEARRKGSPGGVLDSMRAFLAQPLNTQMTSHSSFVDDLKLFQKKVQKDGVQFNVSWYKPNCY